MSMYSVSNTMSRPCWVPEFMDEDSSGMLDETEIFLAMRRLGYHSC